MGILDIGVNPKSHYQEITGQAKIDLTNDIIDRMANEISGKQLLILNKVLEEVLAKYEVFIENKIDVNENYTETNQALLDLFIKAKRLAGLSPRTIDYYLRELTDYIEYLTIALPNVEAEDIRTYLQYRVEISVAGLSKTGQDNIRRVLSTFFLWLHNEGYLLKNPMTRVSKIKAPKRKRHPLNDTEIELIRDTIGKDKNKLIASRDLAIFELLLSSGIRISECVQLNRNDINFHDNSFRVIGKGDKEREAYFNDRTRLRLQEYLNLRTDDEPPLFVSNKKPYNRLGTHGIERRLRDTGRMAGVKENVHPHKLRHTFATNMLKKGMPLEIIQQCLGHEDMKTTLIYAEVNQADVKHSHQKYSGG